MAKVPMIATSGEVLEKYGVTVQINDDFEGVCSYGGFEDKRNKRLSILDAATKADADIVLCSDRPEWGLYVVGFYKYCDGTVFESEPTE